MSYAQAMKWAKKHPKGIKHNYMGFDCASGKWPAPWCKKCDNHFSNCTCKIDELKEIKP